MQTNAKSQRDDALFEEALSPIVNKLIDKNYETSQDKIATQMAPLIGSAIREQIKSQKDDVVDALYPVIGNMISRYVTKSLEDMIQAINTQVQNGLSLQTLKRKLKAKIQGVSESELLLQENANASIQALFLIHKETGIILAHSQNPDYPINDPDMIASMMTAIRSFVNEWIEQNSEHQELGEIDYSGNKIIIETSAYSYLAVIVEGAAYKTTYDKIRTTLEHIVTIYGDEIRDFNGDVSSFSNIEIYKEITLLLTNKEIHDTQKKEKKSIHPLLLLLPIILLIFFSNYFYNSYRDASLENSANTVLHNAPQLTSYRIDVKADDATLELSGSLPFTYHKQLASKLVSKITGVRGVKNNIIVVNSFQDPMQISANIAYLLAGFNAQKGVHLNYKYDFTTLTLEGSLPNTQIKQKVLKELKKIEGIKNIHDDTNITPPPLNESIYFQRAKTTLDSVTQAKLIHIISQLKNSDKNQTILLTSYSDMIGTIEKNRRLSNKRVANVIAYLQDIGKISQKIVSVTKISAPEGVDAKKEPQKARCMTITYNKETK